MCTRAARSPPRRDVGCERVDVAFEVEDDFELAGGLGGYGGLGELRAVELRAQRIEQHEQARAAGIDDARLAQGRQLGRRRIEGFLCRGEHALEQRVESYALGEGGIGSSGGRAQDGDDGAFDRVGDGAVDELDGEREGIGKRGGVHAGVRGGVCERAQDLGQDHAGVAAGATHGADGEGLGDVTATVGLRERSLHGVRHIGAGVSVRDRKHVECVDIGAVPGELRHGALRPVVEAVRV